MTGVRVDGVSTGVFDSSPGPDCSVQPTSDTNKSNKMQTRKRKNRPGVSIIGEECLSKLKYLKKTIDEGDGEYDGLWSR